MQRRKGLLDFGFTVAAAGGGGGGQNPSADQAVPSSKGNPTAKVRARDYKAEEAARLFQHSWLKTYPWLRTYQVFEKGAAQRFVYCNSCSLATISLCAIKNPKLSQFKQHVETDKHQKSVIAHPREAAEFDPRGAVSAANARAETKSVVQMVLDGEEPQLQQEFDRKLIQFQLVFNLLKHARPVTDYLWLQETLRANAHTCGAVPGMHCGDNAAWEIADAIAEVAREHTRTLIQKSTSFGLTLDASAAVDNVDYMNLQARAWAEGKLHNCFLGMEPLGLRTTAAGQFELVMEALPKNLNFSAGDLQRKLAAIASDGCNTMQGRQGGLCTLMEKQCPHIVKISCTAHKVNLVAETLDEQLQFKRISDVVRDVATYFNRSPKRTELLKQCQEKLNLPDLKLLRVNDTRWMPLRKALDNLLRILPAVLLALDAERKEKSEEVCYYYYNISIEAANKPHFIN